MRNIVTMLALPAMAAAAALQPRDGTAPSPWISISGSSHATITPTVSAGSTISGAPESLTKTSTFLMQPTTATGTKTTKSTGLPPAASATAADGSSGAVLQCSNYQGEGAPFCQPRSGSLLPQGKSFYITWDPTYFTEAEDVYIYGDYSQPKDKESHVFTSDAINSAVGFYKWDIASNFLTLEGDWNDDNAKVELHMLYTTNETELETHRLNGTVFYVTSHDSSFDFKQGHKTNKAAAIAAPIVVVLVVAAFCAILFVLWRRTGHIPFISGGRSSSNPKNSAYPPPMYPTPTGAARSANDAAPSAPAPAAVPAGGDVQLTDRDSWSKTGNVFRDELRRQEQERGTK